MGKRKAGDDNTVEIRTSLELTKHMGEKWNPVLQSLGRFLRDDCVLNVEGLIESRQAKE